MKAMIIAATMAASVTAASASPFGSLERMQGNTRQMQNQQQLWMMEQQLRDIQSAQRAAEARQFLNSAPSRPVYIAPLQLVRPLPWETIRPGPGGCYGCDQ